MSISETEIIELSNQLNEFVIFSNLDELHYDFTNRGILFKALKRLEHDKSEQAQKFAAALNNLKEVVQGEGSIQEAKLKFSKEVIVKSKSFFSTLMDYLPFFTTKDRETIINTAAARIDHNLEKLERPLDSNFNKDNEQKHQHNQKQNAPAPHAKPEQDHLAHKSNNDRTKPASKKNGVPPPPPPPLNMKKTQVKDPMESIRKTIAEHTGSSNKKVIAPKQPDHHTALMDAVKNGANLKKVDYESVAKEKVTDKKNDHQSMLAAAVLSGGGLKKTKVPGKEKQEQTSSKPEWMQKKLKSTNNSHVDKIEDSRNNPNKTPRIGS